MPSSDIDWQGRAGKWSTVAFLVAGVLSSFAAIAMGLVLVTDMSQGAITGLPSMLGLLCAYAGMLGLYPRLAEQRPRTALASVCLLLLPIAALVGFLVYEFTVGGEPPFVGPLFMLVFVGFALGITLFGSTSYLTKEPSRAVGLALLAFALPWIVRVGLLPVFGAAPPAWLDFATSSLTAVALLAIGYLLWTEGHSQTREEPAPEPTP